MTIARFLQPYRFRACAPACISLQKRPISFYDTKFNELRFKPLQLFNAEDLLEFALERRLTEDMLINSAKFLQRALPVRMARRIHDMQALPYIAMINPHMQDVYHTYVEVCERMMDFPPVETALDEAKWNILLKRSLEDGRRVLPALAKASKEISMHVDHGELTRFLDGFLASRIARRVLVEQHIALHEQMVNPGCINQHTIGVINLDCDPTHVCRKAYNVAARVAKSAYGIAPLLDVHLHAPDDYKFSYISRHIEYILLEVFKNAIRATVEHNIKHARAVFDEDLPRIQVHVYDHPGATTFQVSDMGGGISESVERDVFDYAFSTVDTNTKAPPITRAGPGIMDIVNRPMAGEGFGLPLARSYAQFFGGNLKLVTYEGHKTDVVIKLGHLKREHYIERLKDEVWQPEDNDEVEVLAEADAEARAEFHPQPLDHHLDPTLAREAVI
eukprot:TRINITY_DN9893_c0_g2_i1.p1 TRINITY_DN9893_c0_g2~~TRINITY_DN9893_c0_g2_i1.p1  ORF type:complete len:446 (+),score=91.98 TRINITY_DN9893_c0_g2_i1:208-1545(+)